MSQNRGGVAPHFSVRISRLAFVDLSVLLKSISMNDVCRDNCDGNQQGGNNDAYGDIALRQFGGHIQLWRNQVKEEIAHDQKDDANGTKHERANSTNPKIFGQGDEGKQGSRRQQIHDFSPGSKGFSFN